MAEKYEFVLGGTSMREYIIEFLNKQKPSLTYFRKENHRGIFSWIWCVWLSQTDEILSLLVVYTPVSVLFIEAPTNERLIGKTDDSFYGKLSRMIVRYRTYEEAVTSQTPDLAAYSTYFLWSCDVFVDQVRSKKATINSFRLLHFDCIEAKLGIFSLLYEAGKQTEHCILMLGRKNFVQISQSPGNIQDFFDYLFEGRLDIEWNKSE